MVELSGALQTEEVTTTQGLVALEPQWSSLWAGASRATPFQSPQWLIPLWRHLGSGELSVLVFRDSTRLVGLLPLIFLRDAMNQRRFTLLGGGVSDYQDAIFTNGVEAIALRHAWRWCEEAQERLDSYRFERLPGYSGLLHEPLPAGWNEKSAPQESCPVLALNRHGLAASVPPHQLANLRYYRKRAEKTGAIEIATADENDVRQSLAELMRLHRSCWLQRGQAGVLADPAVAAFHAEAAPALLRSGVLRLYLLRIDGRAVAALYGLMHRRRFYYYIGGFDPEYRHLSPGTLLIGHAIERAIAEGALEFDFLRGGESYKYLWGAKDRVIYRRALQPPPARTRRRSGKIVEDNCRLEDKDVRVF